MMSEREYSSNALAADARASRAQGEMRTHLVGIARTWRWLADQAHWQDAATAGIATATD
jgi:hypothetical protein